MHTLTRLRLHALPLCCLPLLALGGCQGGDAPEKRPTTTPSASAASSPAPTGVEAPAYSGPSLEQRRGRFSSRKTVRPPSSLGPRWRRLIEGAQGRVTSAHHALFSRRGRGPGAQRLTLELRLFGLDEEISSRMAAALSRAGVPQVEAGGALPERGADKHSRWTLERFPLIAPPGEPREVRMVFDWRYEPETPAEQPSCKRPPALEAPAELPAFLRRWSREGTVRRLVGVEYTQGSPKRAPTASLLLWFRNAESLDFNTKALVEGAGRAGYTHDEGGGASQRWSHPSGASIELRDVTRPLPIGCRFKGSTVQLTWEAEGP